ncbi:MAG TPA: substrate-binding domain-containing protein [Tepidisphaeraceae bacterium]|nr:substrate-binding domain-containing protein [Tepidisphaeraceae bacterium]
MSVTPQISTLPLADDASGGSRLPLLAPQQAMLLVLILVEIGVFSFIGTNFFTAANAFEVPRLSVELGLIALALTPVIVTGGIDLSVGSLLGLCAVLFGKLWRDAGLPPWLAGVCAVAIGAAAGLLNATLITRMRIPALIVTLGSFSLFRGIGEGLTGGVDNFTNFPASFLRLGQGYLGPIPMQLPVLVLAAVFFWLLLHRSRIGRELSAIGFSSEAARYSGVRVERRVALAYVLSGLCAGLGAVIYVARVGQAKADAGTGYELLAITAVVLGGTSIFGGRGNVLGTLLGLFSIAILQNGLRLADLPPELAGILTGLLLIIAIGLDWRPSTKNRAGSTNLASATTTTIPDQSAEESFEMKNSHVAVLSAVILVAALIITGGNFMLVRSLEQRTSGRAGSDANGGGPGNASSGKQVTIAMMPKSKGNAYFIACRRGAEEAAKELGVELLWDGPTDPNPAKQNEIVETWITRGVDVIAVAVENREGISTALRKAQEAGIKVLTWDSDAEPDARSFFVNQATPQGIGTKLMDTGAKAMNGKGEFAVISASLTSANQNEWLKYIDERMNEKYPNIERVANRPCDDLQKKAFDEATALLNSHPDLKLIMAICSPAVPGAAEAVKQSGRNDVKVVGLGLPNDNKPYVHEGITDTVILWNTMDLGYLTVYAAKALADGELEPGAETFEAGRLGKREIEGDNILLGQPFSFTKANIDQFDF